jgi:hypothetical protein
MEEIASIYCMQPTRGIQHITHGMWHLKYQPLQRAGSLKAATNISTLHKDISDECLKYLSWYMNYTTD